LVRLGIPPFQVASSLLGAVAQRLIRVNCTECREAYEPSKEELEILFGENIPDKKPKLYRGKGCNACHDTGYKGRQGVFEILENAGGVRKSVFDGESEEKMRDIAITHGMRTLKVQGVQKVLDGTTTLDELLRVVDIRGE